MKIIDNKRYYSMSETASIIGKTRCTILRWYEYEKDKDTQLLPQFIIIGNNNARYWLEDDLHKFYTFMESTPRGAMEAISKKYNGDLKKLS